MRVKSGFQQNAGWNQRPWPFIVSNTQRDDTLAADSNFGWATTCGAPGTDIFSTVTTNDLNFPTVISNGTYRSMSGTQWRHHVWPALSEWSAA